MTRNDIISMAREAGFFLYDLHDIDGQDLGESVEADDFGVLERFARLLLAADREACAQLCDGLPAPASCTGVETSLWDVATMACAQAVRARGANV